jgi:hypothetical protein
MVPGVIHLAISPGIAPAATGTEISPSPTGEIRHDRL